MTDDDRFRLLGTYTTPRLMLGTVHTCAARDCDVFLVAYTNASISWPIGRRKGTPARSLIVFGDPEQAIRRESNQAVCHWFGVTGQTVSRWRKALGVGVTNDGTHRLRSDYTGEEWAIKARAKGQAKADDPERRAKIAAAMKGKTCLPHVLEAMQKGRTGKPQSAAFKSRMAEVMRERARTLTINGRAWTTEEMEMLRTMPAKEVAARTGRSLKSVYCQRREIGLPDGRRR